MADEDFVQIKIDIGDLKSNVGLIKTDVTDMKHSVSVAIDRISTSMAILATVTEKLLHNDEAHRIMNTKIEELGESQEQHSKTLAALKTSHESCIDMRKKIEDERKNSPWQKAKDKAVEYLFIVIITLSSFVLISHFSDYLKFINNKEIKSPTLTAPVPVPSD